MKKLILIAALIILAGSTYAQVLKKGNTLSLHVFTIILNPGVTTEQYLQFCKNKYIPAWEENFQGLKVYMVKGIKGECTNCDGIILAWKTKADMTKYYNPDGSGTELTKAANAKMKSLIDELGKLVKMTNDKYTSWEIQ
jgi:hypothetical protein